MIDNPALRSAVLGTHSKILMLVVDGLGGIRDPSTGKSELETALIPNLDALARTSAGGLTIPVLPGITPGSGPGHMALFGYDPLRYIVGRGALEAMGVDGIDFEDGDIVARGNFCTVNSEGVLQDRRAGRIPSAESRVLCEKLDGIKVHAVQTSVYLVRDHRFVLRMRGDSLSDQVTEMDPQNIGVPLQNVKPLVVESGETAEAANEFVSQAREMLGREDKANMIMLRGFSEKPHLPSMSSAYKLDPVAIAAYPMYRGLAAAIGMKVLDPGLTFSEEVDALTQCYTEHDFFFIHYKPADAAGEDGDFQSKVQAFEELDAFIPRLMDLDPDVLIIAGDHATPSVMGGHSWHPVPLLLRSRWTGGDSVDSFDESACARGSLGTMPAVHLMTLALAHAGKLGKFGA